VDCLVRELGEELPHAQVTLPLVFLGMVEGKEPFHKGVICQVYLYLGDVRGDTKRCGAEVAESARVLPGDLEKYNLSEPTRTAVWILMKKGYL
jgi:hypothetical protein